MLTLESNNSQPDNNVSWCDELIDAINTAQLRKEFILTPTHSPQTLAPLTHAVTIDVLSSRSTLQSHHTHQRVSPDSFARYVLLCDPDAEERWGGIFRVVAYVQVEVDSAVAHDPLLSEVTWSWLTEALSPENAHYSHLGGTVTTTHSVRFGEMSTPTAAFRVELRASWTITQGHPVHHLHAVAHTLANALGLPPEDGVTTL